MIKLRNSKKFPCHWGTVGLEHGPMTMLSKRPDDKKFLRPSKRPPPASIYHKTKILVHSEELLNTKCKLAWATKESNRDCNRRLMGNLALKLKQRKNNTTRFSFHVLPQICKLHIFSYLSMTEKGSAAQVCQEWNFLVRSSSLWSCIDLTLLISQQCQNSHSPFDFNPSKHICNEKCYPKYRDRLNIFHSHLTSIKPVIKELCFALDLREWFDYVCSLFESAQCSELRKASLNWKETPTKPFEMDRYNEAAHSDQNEHSDHVCRHRQRQFVKFIELFVEMAPNVKQLELPFDWSPRSVNALSSLCHLETLRIEKYFVFQGLDQSLLDKLIHPLVTLKYLELEVWTPDARGISCYSLSSKSLEYLDISNSRGFYLGEVNLPSLRVFKAILHPWSGPLVMANDEPFSCLHHVLSQGAPNLKQLNNHQLHVDWRENIYDELDIILKAACSCPLHDGWMM